MRSASFRGLTLAAAVTAGLMLPAMSAPASLAAPRAAAAATPELFVDSATGSGCSDTGSGTEQQPFCTIGAAATAAQPGQTVLVAPGEYPSFTITESGTPGDPITFQADTTPGGDEVQVENLRAFAAGITVSGAHDVAVNGFFAQGATSFPGIVVQRSSSDVTISASAIGDESPAIEVTGGSSDVTVSQSSATAEQGPGLEVNGGTGIVVTDSTIFQPATGNAALIDASAGAVITGNTVVAACTTGISTDAGATMENNIVEVLAETGTNQACTTLPASINVVAGAQAQTTSDDNLIDPTGGPLYDWDGTSYTSLADFTAATGQGQNDIAADPGLVGGVFGGSAHWFELEPTSPAVDSADANAPDELPVDQLGDPRADDPSVANTGTGPGYYDRGSVELEGPVTDGTPTTGPDPADGPLAVTVTAPVTTTWTTNGPIGIDTFTFPDALFPVISTTQSAEHIFQVAGAQPVDVGQEVSGERDTSTVTAVPAANFIPVAPTRILDTITGTGVAAGAVPAGGTLILPFSGVGSVPAAQVSAVAIHVTVTQSTARGSLTVFPADSAAADSNISFRTGKTVGNLVTLQPGSGGIEFQNNSTGTVQVIADLDGYFAAGGSGLTEQSPVRVLHARAAAGTALTLDLSGQVPAAATAAVLDVTVTKPKADGSLTAFGAGQAEPTASSLDFTKGQTVTDLVIVPLVNGEAEIQNGATTPVRLTAELTGYFSPDGPDSLVPAGPVQVVDTRTGVGADKAAVQPGATLTFTPQVTTGADAAVLNITVTKATADGSLTVFADGTKRPNTPSLGFTAGHAAAGLVIVPDAGGKVSIFNNSAGTVQLTVDEQGYFIST
jgi:hypothetical protein